MKYKLFGIYSNEKYLSVILDKNKDLILVVNFEFSNFKEISNQCINDFLAFNNFKLSDRPFYIENIKMNPKLFKNYGYLGQINEVVQDKLLMRFDKLEDIPF